MKFSSRTFASIFGFGVGLCVLAAAAEDPNVELRNTVTGELLDLSTALPEGRDTPGVKKFLQTGVDPYLEDVSCLKAGEQTFLSACSGCHGHIGEGKIGPGLNDDYWTYPQNTTDAGLFSTIFGGAQAQMGPQYENLNLDEILRVMSWVRHLYKDDVQHAFWLNDEQKKKYHSYAPGETFPDDPPGQCAKTSGK
ncbi:MAG: cytochrome c(L), periplasmic [Methylocella sp.]